MTVLRVRRRALALPNDVEMLQTDIMRFLAIICMCLMIMFALVQSLPLTGDNVRPRLTSAELVEQRLLTLQESLRASQAQLQALNSEIAQRSQALAELREAQQLESESLARLDDMVAHKTRALRQADARLVETGRMLERAQQRLQSAEDMLAQKTQSLAAVEDTLLSAQTHLELAETAILETHAELELPTAPEPEPPVIRPAEPEPAEPQGFSLSFTSEEALRRLIAEDGTVALFLITGGRSWRLSTAADEAWSFVPEPAPGSLYEMEISSVPYMIRAVAKKVFAAHGRSGTFYGVQLAPRMDADIKNLMRSRSGGNIVIGLSGEVYLQ